MNKTSQFLLITLPQVSKWYCPGLLSVCCDKYCKQKELREERLYLAYMSIMRRIEGRNSGWSRGRNHGPAHEHSQLAFLDNPRLHARGDITCSSLGSSISIIDGENAHGVAYRPTCGGNFVNCGSLFSDGSSSRSCRQWTSQHKHMFHRPHALKHLVFPSLICAPTL